MKEVKLDLGVQGEANETALAKAVEAFARWRVETSGTGWMERDAPDIIMKTVCEPDGTLKKVLIFQDRRWVDTFLSFWRDELSLA